MLRTKKLLRIVAVIGILVVVGALLATAAPQKATPKPPQPDKVALGEDEVKQLLLLMDTDKNGKISKQEFMTFMEAEFARLDRDKNAELDAKELTQSSLRVSHFFTAAGK
jgi:EF hand